MQKVTVVIPNFNGIAYIRKCLDSLRKQDFSDFSVIVVDNGSSDGSRESCSPAVSSAVSREPVAGIALR